MFGEEDREKRERERKRDKHQSVASLMRPDQGSNPQPRDVPRPGMELSPFLSMVWHSNQLSHLFRAVRPFLVNRLVKNKDQEISPCEDATIL